MNRSHRVFASRSLAAALAVGLLGISLAASAAPLYNVTDIPLPSFATRTYQSSGPSSVDSYAYSINDNGQVVGDYGLNYASGAYHTWGFIYDSGTGTFIDTYNDPGNPNHYQTSLSGINNSGLVVGGMETGLYSTTYSDTFSTNGYVRDASGNYHSIGTNINVTPTNGFIDNSGNVAGTTDIQSSFNNNKAFIYTYGGSNTQTNLVLPGGTNSGADGINNGIVVGSSSGTNPGAFMYNSSTGKYTDLGMLPGGDYAQASGINSNGVVAGFGDSSTSNYLGTPFVYNSSSATPTLTPLALPGASNSYDASVYGINNAGTVIGNITDGAGGGTQRAAIWDANNPNLAPQYLTNLIDPASGLSIQDAYGINSSGQIVGDAYDSNGNYYAVLLTPTSSSNVPEPATLALVSLGLLGVGFSRKRKAS